MGHTVWIICLAYRLWPLVTRTSPVRQSVFGQTASAVSGYAIIEKTMKTISNDRQSHGKSAIDWPYVHGYLDDSERFPYTDPIRLAWIFGSILYFSQLMSRRLCLWWHPPQSTIYRPPCESTHKKTKTKKLRMIAWCANYARVPRSKFGCYKCASDNIFNTHTHTKHNIIYIYRNIGWQHWHASGIHRINSSNCIFHIHENRLAADGNEWVRTETTICNRAGKSQQPGCTCRVDTNEMALIWITKCIARGADTYEKFANATSASFYRPPYARRQRSELKINM